MALSRAKYKRVADLYVTGTEVVLKDGTVLWLQVLNPFEIEEARQAAQTAKSRLIMALQQHGGDEMAFIDAALWEDGPDGARQRVVDAKANGVLVDVINALRIDPEWTERIGILDRTDEATEPLEPAERDLVAGLTRDYVAEIERRVRTEEEYLKQKYASVSDEEVREEYKRLYIERRGADIANQEFRVNEIFHGARVCEGVQGEDGTWNHEACEGHQLQVYESKAEVRMLPEDLTNLLGDTYLQLAMSVRDAQGLVRLASSSDSSRQPSEAEESTLSTPDGTPSAVPGTSPQPSPTP